MSEGALVSVVTPFYNTAKYLRECIDSVLAQTHRNFEYLLVDNHSNDGSAEIAKEYVNRDPRVRYLRTPEFFKQDENYSYALTQISDAARFCKIVQADDWIFPRCITDLAAAAERYPSSGIVSSYILAETRVWGDGLQASKDGVTFLGGREAARQNLLRPIFLFGSPTTLLYRADVVRSRRPFYVEGPLHSDTEAVYEILRSHDFVFVHQVLSFMRQQEGATMTSWRWMNPAELDRMIMTKRYGPEFLDTEEYEACLEAARQWLYSGLARQWLRSGFRFKNKEYWERQQRGLDTVGERIQTERLIKGATSIVLENLVGPFQRLRRPRSP
jgi:glycosyltransferase involved in cell wall biosynthesis